EQLDGERRAAKYVEPARRVARYRMLRRFSNRSGELQATVKPLPDLSDHAHVFVFLSKAFVSLEADNLLSMETNSFRAPHGALFPKREAVGDPGVGNSPARIVTIPSCTLYGYSNSPRSGAPEAREPSRKDAPPWQRHMNKPASRNPITGQPQCHQLMTQTR